MPLYLYDFSLLSEFSASNAQSPDATTDLVRCLVNYLPEQNDLVDWQVCWLQNAGRPIIGLLPKVSWCVYPFEQYQTQFQSMTKTSFKTVPVKVKKRIRSIPSFITDIKPSDFKEISYDSTFDNWLKELIDYSDSHKSNTKPPSQTYDDGLMGFIGYDISAKQLSPNCAIAFAEQPCAFLGHYDLYLAPYNDTEHTNTIWQLHYQDDTPAWLVEQVDRYLTDLANYNESSLAKSCYLPSSLPPLTLYKDWHYKQYRTAFLQTEHYLYQGDSYQINLTQRWQGSFTNNAESKNTVALIDYLPKLYANTQAPYSGYLGLPDFELLSCSPELFFTFVLELPTEHSDKSELTVFTKPIKGTRPRGADKAQDEFLKNELIASEKDRSENVMIVDLLRNDLGKYAKTGSVQVPKLFAIESFSNVHHMVSTITATLRPEVHPLTVLFGSLPAGSITGTPKKRAVELISELEVAARGAYCGTMGYMNFDGSGQWNVLIRTLQVNAKGDVALWAGGGITVRSECEAEYQESIDKVSNLLSVLTTDSGTDNKE